MKKILEKLPSPVAIIVFAVGARLLPHPPNMVPITALALFGGVYLGKKYALLVPLIALFVSDVFLGFHNLMLFVYGSFLLTGIIGLWLRKHKKLGFIVAGALVSSILFFAITNFGVWVAGNMYPHTLTGLVESYTLAIPFFRNSLIGDLGYTGLFFGGYELVSWLISKPSLKFARATLDFEPKK